MLRYIAPLVSSLAFLSLTTYLVLERPEWLPVYGESEEVLVFLIGSDEGVDEIRRSVDPARIVSSTGDAIALVEGRIFAADAEAVTTSLNQVGWADRRIEVFHLEKASGLQGPGARGRKHTGGASDEERLARLRELVKKPTLSAGEQMFVLQAMADGIEL